MKKSGPALAASMMVLLAASAFAAKLDENARAKDYSRDYQVPAAPTAGNAVVLSESFDAAIPPAGWTVINNAPGGPEWTDLVSCGEMGNYTNGTGGAACVNSDAFGEAEFDTELRTPALDLSTYTAPASLTFTANYQNFANLDFFDVDVSTDGGGAWTNLLRWNEDHGAFNATPGVDVNLDIAAYAGVPSVLFRFRYYDPNTADWDWYAQVDNVVVDATAGATCSLACPADVTFTTPYPTTSAVVTFPAPTPTGTCGTITCTPASGSSFPLGVNPVSCGSATGGATCGFNVTVSQGPAPSVLEIPTASTTGLAILGLLLAGAAFVALRRS